MIGIYFSGTGNTKYCIELFAKELGADTACISIEEDTAVTEIKKTDDLIIAYPVYFSNIPKVMKDFIIYNKAVFAGKRIFIIATMALFSGDGAGYGARLLSSYGAHIIGGLHLQMPDCISDGKILKKTVAQNRIIIQRTEIKLKKAAKNLRHHHADNEGIGFAYHIAGLFGQRLWFFNATKNYSDKLTIHNEECIACGLCTKLCPMKNLSVSGKTVQHKNTCTMCYRCINRCPQKALTLLGKKVTEQYHIEECF